MTGKFPFYPGTFPFPVPSPKSIHYTETWSPESTTLEGEKTRLFRVFGAFGFLGSPWLRLTKHTSRSSQDPGLSVLGFPKLLLFALPCSSTPTNELRLRQMAMVNSGPSCYAPLLLAGCRKSFSPRSSNVRTHGIWDGRVERRLPSQEHHTIPNHHAMQC